MPSTHMKTAAPAAVMDGLLSQCRAGLAAAETLHDSARSRITATVSRNGKIDAMAFDAAQFAAHGFAWIATYVSAIRQMRRWAEAGAGGELEQLILQVALVGIGHQLGVVDEEHEGRRLCPRLRDIKQLQAPASHGRRPGHRGRCEGTSDEQ